MTKFPGIPPIPANDTALLSLVPEKNDPNFYIFATNLVKNNTIVSASFPSRTLYFVPAPMIPSLKTMNLKGSLFGFVIPKFQIEPHGMDTVGMVPMSRQPSKFEAVPVTQIPVYTPTITQSISPIALSYTPPVSNTLPSLAPQYPQYTPAVPYVAQEQAARFFMKDVKLCILGYGLQTPAPHPDVVKRVNGIVKFLTEQGGAIYFDKLPNEGTSLDLIVVCSFAAMVYNKFFRLIQVYYQI